MSDFRFVALLDVMGYRDYLDQDNRSGVGRFKNLMENALHSLTTINEGDIQYQAISDTLIFSADNGYPLLEFLRAIKSVYWAFMRQGLLLRGGIVLGKHFKSGHLTYSPALALAHELEKNVAIYPRIVLDNIVVQAHQERGTPLDGLVGVHNDKYFLNIIENSNWDEAYSIFDLIYKELKTRKNESGIPISISESVFLKYWWFEQYLFSLPFADHTKQSVVGKPEYF